MGRRSTRGSARDLGPRIVAGYIGDRLHGPARRRAVEDRAGPLRRSRPLQRHRQSQPAGHQQPYLIFPGQQLKIPIGA